MRGEVFSPAVVFSVDDDGDPGVEIIWEGRRLCIGMYPASGEGPAWHHLTKGVDGKLTSAVGSDLVSLMPVFFDIARFQAEHDEHNGAEERAAIVARIDAARAKACGP